MYDTNNIFAKIIRGEIPCARIYEDDRILAFNDIAPAAPIHVLVIPKGEYMDYSDFVTKAPPSEVLHYFAKINDIALSLELDQLGFRLCSNRGAKSGQSVFHFHTHILGGARFGDMI